jgi:hypothetical protein
MEFSFKGKTSGNVLKEKIKLKDNNILELK